MPYARLRGLSSAASGKIRVIDDKVVKRLACLQLFLFFKRKTNEFTEVALISWTNKIYNA
jgi:hypothetical protein